MMHCDMEREDPRTNEPSCDEILANLVELAGLFVGGRVPDLHFVEFARNIELRAPSCARPGASRGLGPPVMFLRPRVAVAGSHRWV